MSMVEEGKLSDSLLARAVRGEDWTKSSNRAALTKLRVVRARFALPGSRPPEEEAKYTSPPLSPVLEDSILQVGEQARMFPCALPGLEPPRPRGMIEAHLG